MQQTKSRTAKRPQRRTKTTFNLEKPSAARSSIMRAVRSINTTPEKKVRSLVHRLGFRFRLHRSNLPGKPDLVFPSRKKALFVNGCFWHGHRCRRGARIPKTNRSYWLKKIAANRSRDHQTKRALSRLGWRSLVIWECELSHVQATRKRIGKYLGSTGSSR